ncbi:MAG: hypothetical protein ACK5OX_03700 [Desertimonas sp.]
MSSTGDTHQPPNLMMPAAEADHVREILEGASVVLEYGSGGSTVLAAEHAQRVMSVESDARWVALVRKWFEVHPPHAEVSLHHVDIGPTGPFGRPTDPTTCGRWPRYPTAIWDASEFVEPDVVLIDGRFRLACFVTVALRCRRPVRVLWDDYDNRPHYHRASELASPTRVIGRLAEFHLVPTALPRRHLTWMVESFVDER